MKLYYSKDEQEILLSNNDNFNQVIVLQTHKNYKFAIGRFNSFKYDKILDHGKIKIKSQEGLQVYQGSEENEYYIEDTIYRNAKALHIKDDKIIYTVSTIPVNIKEIGYVILELGK